MYAYPGEIDAWRASRKVVAEPPPARPLWKLPAFALTMLLCLIMVGNGSRPVAAQQSPVLAKRLICEGTCADNEANLSPDGRWMVKTDWDTGDLAIRDMATGQQRRLMAREGSYQDKASKDGGAYGESPVFSPDMRQIIYLWNTAGKKDDVAQLRVMANEPGAKSRVVVDNPENDYYEPAAWSPDGKSVLVTVRKRDLTWQLAWVSVADGALKPLTSLGWRIRGGRMRPSLSPDGRHVAYAALALNPKSPTSSEPGDVRIYLVASDGSRGIELEKTAGVNNNPIWTPDGTHILFTSDRSGSLGLWSIAVQDGRPAGAASLLRADSGDIHAMGVRAGSLYYSQWTQDVDYVSIAGIPGGAVHAGEGFAGMFPQWSPDGKSISFKRHHPGNAEAFDLVIHSLENGEERTYSTILGTILRGPARWFYDSLSVQVAVLQSGTPHPYRIDLKTGEFKSLPAGGPISPDDTTVYSLRSDPKDVNAASRFVAVNLSTGGERTVWVAPKPGPTFGALSFDGRTLAIVSQDSAAKTVHFARVGVDGAGYREIYSTPRLDVGGLVTWTKDGRAILSTRRQNGKIQVIRIPADGGEPESTGIEVTGNLQYMDVSPDGSRLVFSSMKTILELWAADNILAALK